MTTEPAGKKAMTVRIDAQLLKAAQHFCIDQEMTLIELVEKGLDLAMKEGRTRGN